MPVIRLLIDADELSVDDLTRRLTQAIVEFDLSDYDEFAMAFEWSGEFDHELLKCFVMQLSFISI